LVEPFGRVGTSWRLTVTWATSQRLSHQVESHPSDDDQNQRPDGVAAGQKTLVLSPSGVRGESSLTNLLVPQIKCWTGEIFSSVELQHTSVTKHWVDAARSTALIDRQVCELGLHHIEPMS
jgi:putative ribosome biogenesis GTPase RsgA